MIKNKIITKWLKFFLLLIIPVVFLFVVFQIKQGLIHYSLVSVDPEMAYLYNSLAILHGHYTHFVDHPGIPLQYIGAAVIGVVSLFRTKESITQDVILNPDYYLHAINIFISLLLFVAIFALGYFTYKKLKNIFAGLIIQFTPFISFAYLNTSIRLLPELLALVIVTGLFIFCLFYLFSEEEEKKKKRKYIIWLAVFAALGISLKITFLPYVIIPFIVLSKFKEKIQYGMYLILFSAFFLLPALNRGNYFFSWITKNFMHSGQYGKGESNIVDVSLYKNNFIEIINNDPFYIITLCALFVGIVVYHIPFLNVKLKKDVLYRCLIGFTFASVAILLVVVKQLKLYYLSPSYVLVIPGLVFLLIILIRNKYLNKYLMPSALVLMLIMSFQINLGKINSSKVNENERQRIITLEFVNNNLKNVPVINVPDYYGSPFTGYCGYYGIAYSGKKSREEIIPALDKVFPDYYTYHDWNEKFNYWLDSGYALPKLMLQYDSLYFYIGNKDMWQKVWHNKIGINQKLDYNAISIFKNKNSGEEIFKLRNEKKCNNIYQMNCDAEILNICGDYFINEQGIEFEGGYSHSSEFSLSGKFSSKLNEVNQYGFGVNLMDVKKGEHYRISVWKYDNNNKNSSLVFESTSNQKYGKSSLLIVDQKNKWSKLQLDIIINDELNGTNCKIYCWYGNEISPAYFDDFCIEKLNE